MDQSDAQLMGDFRQHLERWYESVNNKINTEESEVKPPWDEKRLSRLASLQHELKILKLALQTVNGHAVTVESSSICQYLFEQFNGADAGGPSSGM